MIRGRASTKRNGIVWNSKTETFDLSNVENHEELINQLLEEVGGGV
jgi:hypothetical protein